MEQEVEGAVRETLLVFESQDIDHLVRAWWRVVTGLVSDLQSLEGLRTDMEA